MISDASCLHEQVTGYQQNGYQQMHSPSKQSSNLCSSWRSFSQAYALSPAKYAIEVISFLDTCDCYMACTESPSAQAVFRASLAEDKPSWLCSYSAGILDAPACNNVPKPDDHIAVSSAGYNLSEPVQLRRLLKQELAILGVKPAVEAAVEPALKRSRTGWREYSTLPAEDCDEVKLWDAEVLNRDVSVLLQGSRCLNA